MHTWDSDTHIWILPQSYDSLDILQCQVLYNAWWCSFPRLTISTSHGWTPRSLRTAATTSRESQRSEKEVECRRSSTNGHFPRHGLPRLFVCFFLVSWSSHRPSITEWIHIPPLHSYFVHPTGEKGGGGCLAWEPTIHNVGKDEDEEEEEVETLVHPTPGLLQSQASFKSAQKSALRCISPNIAIVNTSADKGVGPSGTRLNKRHPRTWFYSTMRATGLLRHAER